jgi:hypothetical protein
MDTKLNNTDEIASYGENYLKSLKKITKTVNVSDYEVLTDDGFVDIKSLHETIPYRVYHLKLRDGKELKCADNHIVFTTNYDEITFKPIGLSEKFVKDLTIGSFIMVSGEKNSLMESEVVEIIDLGYEEVMYDFELVTDSNRRYFTNGILSHNTELAKKVAEQLFGDSESLIRLDMSEYSEKFNVSRLIGSPPGYVGHEQGGQLTEQVRRKPYSVILFDEIEKAHPEIYNLLLQVLDEGQLTDGIGRKIDFRNSLIIMTSNVGVRELSSMGKSVGFETQNTVASKSDRDRQIIEKALKKKFPPEFLNRIDETIVFNKLSEEDIHKIIYIEIDKLKERLSDMGYSIKLDKSAMEFIAKEGYHDEYGARPLGRAIQVHIGNLIADEILSGSIVEGSEIKITYDKKDNKVVVKR